jgi:hypothetical protein
MVSQVYIGLLAFKTLFISPLGMRPEEVLWLFISAQIEER